LREGENGFLIDPSDPERFAATIQWFIDNPRAPLSMSAASLELSKCFHLPVLAQAPHRPVGAGVQEHRKWLAEALLHDVRSAAYRQIERSEALLYGSDATEFMLRDIESRYAEIILVLCFMVPLIFVLEPDSKV
jgi:hypothetical protein